MPIKITDAKRAILSALYDAYSAKGLGAPLPLAALGTDAVTQAILDKWTSPNTSLVATSQIPDPSASPTRPPTLPPTQPWPPLVTGYALTLNGVQTAELVAALGPNPPPTILATIP